MPTPIPSPAPSTAAPTAACLTAFPLVVGGTNNNGCELYVAYDVITGSRFIFSGITAEEADTAAARAVFRDAIARVAGVDIDRVTILSVSAADAASRILLWSTSRSARRRRKELLWMRICCAPRRTRR